MAIAKPRWNRNSSGDPEEFRATLGEHIEELRARLFRAIAGFIVGIVIGWFAFPVVLENLKFQVLSGLPKDIKFIFVYHSVMDGFFLQFKMACYIGLILALPLIVSELWGFIRPGLKAQEVTPFKIIVPISSVLFFIGAGLAYTIIGPTIAWFAAFVHDVQVNQDPQNLIFFCIKMMLAFGAGFQLPLVVYFLTKIGLVSPNMLLAYWRQSTVGVFVAALILTPSGDPFSMLVMAIPMTLLFFGSVLIAKFTMKKEEKVEIFDHLD